MEHSKLICDLRQIYKALAEFEVQFESAHSVCLNEAMALCSIGEERLNASQIKERTGMTASHTSKVIKSIEDKSLIERTMGSEDKRQMYFVLSSRGKQVLTDIECVDITIPKVLKPILKRG